MRTTLRLVTAAALLFGSQWAFLPTPAFAGDLEDAAALRAKGKWEEARAKYEAAATADPKSVPAALGLCDSLIALAQYDRAARSLSDALEANPGNAMLLTARARAFVFATERSIAEGGDDAMVRGYSSDAAKWAKLAVEANPKASDARLLLAKAHLFDTSDNDAALVEIGAIATDDPSFFEAHWELGQIATQQARRDNRNKGKWAKAEQHYRNAFAADKTSGLSLLNATWCKQWQGMATSAEFVGDYAACAKLMPDDTRALTGIWKLRKQKDVGPVALAALESLSKTHPMAKSYALVLRGETAIASGHADGVDNLYIDAIEAAGPAENSELYLGMMDDAYRGASLDAEQREKIWSALFKWSPKNFQVPNTAGLWYRDSGKDFKKSAEWYSRAAALATESPQVQQDTGLIYHYHLNDLETAEKYYRKAIRTANDQGLSPSNDGNDPEGVGFRDAMNNLSKVLIAKKRWKDLAEFAQDDVPSSYGARDEWLALAAKNGAEPKDK